MKVPKSFRTFNIDDSTVSLWLFKKTPPINGAAPKYRGRWIDTHDRLDYALKSAISDERNRITEVQEYGLLAENNEGSALTVDSLETHAGLITQQMAAELSTRKIRDMKQIRNTDFYVIKLTHGDKIVYAVKKTESSWQTKRVKDAIYAFFSDSILGLDDKPSFKISRHVDFFIVEDELLISHKRHFESILSYKQAHIEDFHTLQEDMEFQALFSSLDPLIAFVGTNKIHLRRACAIRNKGHYKNQAFMRRLRREYTKYSLHLEFDRRGRLIASEDTCGDIIRALLDHRLLSPFSANLYDVPDATIVQ